MNQAQSLPGLKEIKTKGLFLNFSEVSNLQTNIMRYVDIWIKKEKVTIPQKVIVIKMEQEGVKACTTLNALTVLVRKGYLRKTGRSSRHNGTSYTQLRSVW